MAQTSQAVRSAHVRNISYDPATRELDVEFHQGRRYRYSGVSYDTWLALMKAPSKGSFLRRSIQGQHSWRELP